MRHRTNAGRGLPLGRPGECATLDAVVAGARAGHSQILVLRGEAGIGKTELLDYLEQHAAGCRIARSAGAEAEMELAYAGLVAFFKYFLDSFYNVESSAAPGSAIRPGRTACRRHQRLALRCARLRGHLAHRLSATTCPRSTYRRWSCTGTG